MKPHFKVPDTGVPTPSSSSACSQPHFTNVDPRWPQDSQVLLTRGHNVGSVLGLWQLFPSEMVRDGHSCPPQSVILLGKASYFMSVWLIRQRSPGGHTCGPVTSKQMTSPHSPGPQVKEMQFNIYSAQLWTSHDCLCWCRRTSHLPARLQASPAA